MSERKFYQGKKVLVTGHTGFKGVWITKMLTMLGADVTGYALEPDTNPSSFYLSGIQSEIHSEIGDIRDYEHLLRVFKEKRPEIVIHMAAQPIVREGYRVPRETYEINVMGTVNVCECIRKCESVRSFINVTTDKVYLNNEWEWGYREIEPLDGYDPYSNSKSCSDLITHSYQSSYYNDLGIVSSTVRAGNVIGGGDFSVNRIIPDCVRAAIIGSEIVVRNPKSIRPYQHVLEAVSAYLLLARRQLSDPILGGAYNIGPDEDDCVTTKELVTRFCKEWTDGVKWRAEADTGPHEASVLKLDNAKIKKRLGWKPVYHIDEAIAKTVEWSKAYRDSSDMGAVYERQIKEFMNKRESYGKDE